MDLQPTSPKHQLFCFPITIKRKLLVIFSFLFLIFSYLFFNLLNPFQPNSFLYFSSLSQNLPNTQKSSSSSSSSSESCDYSEGRWVRDEGYPFRSYNENCPFLDPGFRCRKSGRKDEEYLKWRWQPLGCDIPRFNASEFLERGRNGRIVFAGDSIGRNQWESLLCMLAQAVSNKSSIYEVNGNPISKHKGYLSMKFHDYNLTVEYYRVPFLVVIGRPPKNSSNQIRTTIRVDQLHWNSKYWVGADVLVFNAGHWWNPEKTTKMGGYFQEGEIVNMTMDVMEGFRRALQAWKSWAVDTLDPQKTHIFFRSYSPVHYRNGTWNEGGLCDTNTKPETDHTKLEAEPWNNIFISDVVKQMEYANRNAQLLNITYLTEFRSDGHPSMHREPGTPVPAPQDCSHWCLPGVPDTWNELLYAQLLSKGFRTN